MLLHGWAAAVEASAMGTLHDAQADDDCRHHWDLASVDPPATRMPPTDSAPASCNTLPTVILRMSKSKRNSAVLLAYKVADSATKWHAAATLSQVRPSPVASQPG